MSDEPVREWLVYVNTTYYPWAEIVPAATAEEAGRAVADPDAEYTGAIIVLPWAPEDGWVHESWEHEIAQLREEGGESAQKASGS